MTLAASLRRLPVVAALAMTGWAAAIPAQAQPAPVAFARDVRPILADRCFACHGPDARARKAKLRLDQRASALAPRGDDARVAIRPGDPDRSELYRRITAEDLEERMPPPASNLPPLNDTEAATLRRWIEEGAEWGEHWSFRKLPRTVTVPAVGQRDWLRNPIDAFVLARLEAEGLAPSPEASPELLVRRLSFDLTGLPPTLSEIDAFVADRHPGAVGRLVDRLLASPRYAERMASIWLDAARYADTLGYQADREQAVWPWRDWVIAAFDQNLPYDRFLTWQLAGDLMPGATRDQRLATAFNRLHRQTEEGGTVEEEFRVEYVVDRVETFGTAVLGLTIECARCHEHKFDAVSQEDFYRLFAFFQNIDESGQTSHFTDAVPVPALLLADDAVEAELDRLALAISAAERDLSRVRRTVRPRLDAWRSGAPQPGAIRGLVAAFPLDSITEGRRLANRVDAEAPGLAEDGPVPVTGRHGGALELDGENALKFAKVGDFSRSDPFSLGLWVRAPERTDRAVLIHKSKAALDAASRGYQLLIQDGHLTACLAHMWPHNAIKVRARDELPVDRWVHLLLAYDGSSRAAGLRLYVDGERAEVDVVRDGLTKDIVYHRGGAPPLTIGQRFRDRGFKGGQVDDLQVFARCLTAVEVAELVRPGAIAAALRAEPGPAVESYYVANFDPRARAASERLQQLRDQQRRAIEGIPEIMVMEEMDAPRPAYVLRRGDYDAPGTRVTAGTPAALPAFGDRPRNRLGLAQWVTDPDHPLTARVAVNRLWQAFFGRGLVATQEDFGSQGALPSHPELLDWLARRFVDSGWDVKGIVRTIVTSATYRQASDAITPELWRRDPDNILLARAPTYRWPAEMIRDAALAASGLLVEKVGGPPVKPYQPPGLWKEKSGRAYVPSVGDGLYRRSLYTYWKRTSPPPSMILFDMPRRMRCSARRQQTSTPLQALVLLNDPQFVECARVLGGRLLAAGGDRAVWIRAAFRTLTSREPHAVELAVLEALFAEQQREFEADPERAAALVGVGATPCRGDVPAADLAAATMLVSALMSYDGVVMKR